MSPNRAFSFVGAMMSDEKGVFVFLCIDKPKDISQNPIFCVYILCYRENSHMQFLNDDLDENKHVRKSFEIVKFVAFLNRTSSNFIFYPAELQHILSTVFCLGAIGVNRNP